MKNGSCMEDDVWTVVTRKGSKKHSKHAGGASSHTTAAAAGMSPPAVASVVAASGQLHHDCSPVDPHEVLRVAGAVRRARQELESSQLFASLQAALHALTLTPIPHPPHSSSQSTPCMRRPAVPATTGGGAACHTPSAGEGEPGGASDAIANPSTAAPSTADPSTADPSTADPSTADPRTADPSTAVPSTADPSTAAPITAAPRQRQQQQLEPPSQAVRSTTQTPHHPLPALPQPQQQLPQQQLPQQQLPQQQLPQQQLPTQPQTQPQQQALPEDADGAAVQRGGPAENSDCAPEKSDGAPEKSDGAPEKSDGAPGKSDGAPGKSDSAREKSDCASETSGGAPEKSFFQSDKSVHGPRMCDSASDRRERAGQHPASAVCGTGALDALVSSVSSVRSGSTQAGWQAEVGEMALLESVRELRVLGLGSVAESRNARYQLALTLLLRELLPNLECDVTACDPVFSPLDCEVLEHFGIRQRQWSPQLATTMRPTLLYMAHCEASLCESVLSHNWSVPSLSRLCILGNSFSTYTDRWETPGSMAPGMARPDRMLLLSQSGAVLEAAVDEHGFHVQSAFNDTSMHTFPAARLQRCAQLLQ